MIPGHYFHLITTINSQNKLNQPDVNKNNKKCSSR